MFTFPTIVVKYARSPDIKIRVIILTTFVKNDSFASSLLEYLTISF